MSDDTIKWAERALEARDEVERLRAERDAYYDRVQALEGLLACYRLGRQPSDALWRKLEKSQAAIAKAQEVKP